jgi:hypothetical protein
VRVRHVEYTSKPDPNPGELESASEKNARAMEIPADAKELTSLQVLAEPTEPFETVAIVSGTTYRLAGKLFKASKATDGKDYVRIELNYLESSGADQKGIMQISSNVMVEVNNEVRIGGLMRGPTSTGLILSLKQPDAAPAR